MRTVIQRVSHASVTIEGNVKSQIGQGFLILLGICEEDTMEDIEWLVKKIANLRVFGDENDVMNRSILDVQGEALVVSQFTLYASYKKIYSHTRENLLALIVTIASLNSNNC